MRVDEDIVLTLGQIAALQSGYYAICGCATYVAISIVLRSKERPVFVSDVLLSSSLVADSHAFAVVIVAHLMLVIPLMVVWVTQVLSKFRIVLDFVGTVFFLNAAVHGAFFGFPRSLLWWLVNIVELIIIVFASEFLLARRQAMRIAHLAHEIEGEGRG